MFSTGCHHISRLSRDHSTIGMSYKTVESISVREGCVVDCSSGSSVSSLGSLNLRSVSRDYSSIRERYQSSRSSSIDHGMDSMDGTTSMEVGETGSSYSWSVCRYYCSIRVGHQATAGESHTG